MRLNDTQRLLVVIVATAITVGLFWPPYRDALRRINEPLLTNVRSDDVQPADDQPRGDRIWRRCTDSIWPGYLWCGGSWHYGTPPWEDR
jgi:hypothetical protein